jgi:hypothetical protein
VREALRKARQHVTRGSKVQCSIDSDDNHSVNLSYDSIRLSNDDSPLHSPLKNPNPNKGSYLHSPDNSKMIIPKHHNQPQQEQFKQKHQQNQQKFPEHSKLQQEVQHKQYQGTTSILASMSAHDKIMFYISRSFRMSLCVLRTHIESRYCNSHVVILLNQTSKSLSRLARNS